MAAILTQLTVPKNIRKPATSGAASAEPAGSSPTVEATPSPTKRVRASTTPADRKPASKTPGGKQAAKKSGTKRSQKTERSREPSVADIRLRAYFIAERRVQLALHGDPAKDWLEAKQQLLQEAAQRTP